MPVFTNEQGAHAWGVKYVSIPNRSTRSEERRKLQNSAGSSRGRSGGLDAKDESAFSSGGMGWRVAAIGGCMECGDGEDWALSRTT
jgi:hypothetical protein